MGLLQAFFLSDKLSRGRLDRGDGFLLCGSIQNVKHGRQVGVKAVEVCVSLDFMQTSGHGGREDTAGCPWALVMQLDWSRGYEPLKD